MNNYIVFDSKALKNNDFVSLLTQYGKISAVSKNGEKTSIIWNSEDFSFVDGVNILGPFNKEEAELIILDN